ncbi:MAG: AAA family ATPase, partial [Clostridia bacterium]|nr:AAA family ATPase [Clostridia bacterium]
MKLKAIEMQGFKSFPEKTRIGFENGVTAIIGPNGSGKSNVSDAVRWVLGEMSLKSLRGSKMEDVIFNGTAKRSQANYASVSIFLDSENGDDPTEETVVTRKYYRSGESEYYLNKKQVRLKDIYEAFYDTGIGREGYSVIGQGKIAEVLSQKGDERRSIFEEAAGISKFRYKKAEAERKLAATEDNLTRINDILSEIGNRLAPLEKEAENAKRYLALSEEKKGLEVTLWLEKIESLREELSKSEELFAGAKLGLEAGEEKIKATEKEIDTALSLNYEISRKLSEAERRISELDLKYSEEDGKRAIKENDIVHFERLISDCRAEIASSKAEKEGLEEALVKAKETEEEAKIKLDEVKRDYSDKERLHTEKRAEYTRKSLERNDVQRQYNEVLEKRSDLSVAFAEAKANLVNAKRNAESSKEQIERYEKRIAEIKDSIGVVESKLSAAQKAFDAKQEAKVAAEETLEREEA